MTKWVSVKVGHPDTEIGCLALRRETDTLKVYPKFVAWDGKDWIDIDGEAVPGVVAWTKAPEYNIKFEQTVSKLMGCVENDKCENKDCCYFVTLDLLEALLEYIE